METALYLPVKRFLEKLGFTVKGEVGGCDLVALSGDDPPIVVIGELKLSFNLELILQAVDRAAACDEVWLAAKMSARGKGRESDARYRNLCRRLGFGMLAVTNTGDVEVIVKPPTTSPRRALNHRAAMVAPNTSAVIPVPMPMTTPQSRIKCQTFVMASEATSAEPTISSAASVTLRRP